MCSKIKELLAALDRLLCGLFGGHKYVDYLTVCIHCGRKKQEDIKKETTK